MDGVLLVDKPAGPTSHDVVGVVRRTLKTKRVGHTGTLDPFATGLLVVLVGQATRLAQFIDKDEKGYEAVVRFGFETDTGDRTGTKTVASDLSEDENARRVAAMANDPTLDRFRGEIQQVPPMYSAKKVAGKKLYELARAGEAVAREPVAVNISRLDIVNTDGPTARMVVTCSAGTYIRTLAEDIGRAFGVPAHLEELRRTSAGRFSIDDAMPLDAIKAHENPKSLLLPPAAAVADMPEFVLDASRVEKTRHGLSTRHESGLCDRTFIKMLDEEGGLVAIGIYNAVEGVVQPKVVLG